MSRFLKNLNSRQVTLFVLAAMVVLCVAVIEWYLCPEYDELKSLRSSAEMRAIEYSKLTRNLLVSRNVNEQFEKELKTAKQTESDEITLSNFLRDLEALARHPSMTIINIKPLPVKDERTYKVYRAKLAVAGRLQEILKFVSDLAAGPKIIGLDSFSLRGVQGVSKVECGLLVRMIRVISDDKQDQDGLRQLVAGIAEEGTHDK